MRARFRSWWQKTRKPIEVIGFLAVLVIAIALIFVEVRVYGTGFRGKTLWDWLQLLIIPAVLAVGGYLFTFTISRNERKAADRHNQTEREIAQDNQREAALQEYIDKMSELLLEKQLRESKPVEEVRTIARVRTLSVLPRLDDKRKKSVLQFLQESGLIARNQRIVNLEGVDLTKTDLAFINLSGTDLRGVNLSHAYLGFANLSRANLSGVRLSKAYLGVTNLREADLSRADLSNGTYMSFGELVELAELGEANVKRAFQGSTDLSYADLSEADLREAVLREAVLREANLTGAQVTNEQLAEAKSLKGATMPDGSIHP